MLNIIDSFNKSHAGVYGKLSAMCCYFKAKFYTAYMSAYMSIEMFKSPDKTKLPEMIAECKQRGIKFLSPSINDAVGEFVPIDDNTIMLPITFIKGISDNGLNKILKERPFKDFEDFMNRTDRRSLNKNAVSKLIKAGAFYDFNTNKIEMLKIADKTTPDLFFDSSLNMKFEREALGMNLGKHPLDGHINANIHQLENDTVVAINCIVNEVTNKIDKKGNEMCFLKVENTVCSFECVVFAWVFKTSSHILLPNSKLKIQGTVDNGKLLAKKIDVLN